ncbi:hypothetical protein A2617_03225 [Candidatus Daviesbacteria bacterium RIFOXYD1_FULL_41_10]|uniref:Uncharacterized protein n=2 Tax=Candidatus Daviesiibacteriota TaxID=1752718 RepID=A0A1F5N0U4_9BACT|nr:MAG: hypothetical protein UU67_C0039G0004 [Candidatus Daviesbacteria bacterium GW2011_GWB1_41_5]OGE71203.1 MAG: hypothetical protein A2617_03225 [Candidatus Daviesbacteria bacterium RIFOXYD1_FULL_41_10]
MTEETGSVSATLTKLTETSRQNQPVWQTIDAQVVKSKLTRTSRFSPECELTIEGAKYTVEKVTNNEKGDIGRIYQLLVANFKPEEVEPEEVLIERIDRNPIPEVAYKHQAFAIKNAQGEMVTAFVGVHLDLRDEQGHPTGETMLAIGYVATNGDKRFNDLAREIYNSALIDAALEAESWGKKLVLAEGECTNDSEPFWNAVDLNRIYIETGEKDLTEIPYNQPPHAFNPETGEVPEGAGAVPEHLMVQTFGPIALSKERLIQSVSVSYRELYFKSRNNFRNDDAYQKHERAVHQEETMIKGFLDAPGQLIFLGRANRKKVQEEGFTVHGQEDATL